MGRNTPFSFCKIGFYWKFGLFWWGIKGLRLEAGKSVEWEVQAGRPSLVSRTLSLSRIKTALKSSSFNKLPQNRFCIRIFLCKRMINSNQLFSLFWITIENLRLKQKSFKRVFFEVLPEKHEGTQSEFLISIWQFCVRVGHICNKWNNYMYHKLCYRQCNLKVCF